MSSMYSTHPTHLIFLDLTFLILDKLHKLWGSSLHNFLLSLVTSSLLGANISVSILFSYTLNLWSTLSVETQVLHAQSYTAIIIRFYTDFRRGACGVRWRRSILESTNCTTHCCQCTRIGFCPTGRETLQAKRFHRYRVTQPWEKRKERKLLGNFLTIQRAARKTDKTLYSK